MNFFSSCRQWITRHAQRAQHVAMIACSALLLLIGWSYAPQPVHAFGGACSFQCTMALARSPSLSCDSSLAVPMTTCPQQCAAACRHLGMNMPSDAAPHCVGSGAGTSYCDSCTCVPQVHEACSGPSDPTGTCNTRAGYICSESNSDLPSLASVGIMSGTLHPLGDASTGSCVEMTRGAAIRYCTECIQTCKATDPAATNVSCLTTCKLATSPSYNACDGLSLSDVSLTSESPAADAPASRHSSPGNTPGSPSATDVPTPTAAQTNGSCQLMCQAPPAPTPPLTCSSDVDCLLPCQAACQHAYTSGACPASGPGAATCQPVSPGSTDKQCVFSCTITPPQTRSCNPVGTDADAPAAVCGHFAESDCHAAAIAAADATGSTRYAASIPSVCVSADGGTGGGTGTTANPGGANPAGGNNGTGSSAAADRLAGNGAGNTQTIGAGATGGTTLPNPLGNINSLAALVGRLIKGILGVVGSLALLMFIYGGMRWILSAGEPKNVALAQSIIKNATIGMLLIFFSYSISSIVLSFVDEIGSSGGTSSSATNSGGPTLASCVQTAVTAGSLTQADALANTSASWACRQTQADERTNTSVCVTNGCPHQGATTLCCAPAAGVLSTDPSPAAPPTGGPGMGTCTCTPSVVGGLIDITTLVNDSQRSQMQHYCQSANSVFNSATLTCTGRSTQADCHTVETSINSYISSMGSLASAVSVSCPWTP